MPPRRSPGRTLAGAGRRVLLAHLLLFLAAAGSGCVIVDVGVTNPIPGLTTVAVAPFFNQSQERAVDGREVALAYYAELQKVPGFEVVPVGVTEVALREHNLDLASPEEALQLARILNVDAVVVGTITDFHPYYPPRIGLSVNWYSPFPWVFRADIEDAECETVASSDSPVARSSDADPLDRYWEPPPEPLPRRLWGRIRSGPLFRGQSPDTCVAAAAVEAPRPAAVPLAAAGWVPSAGPEVEVDPDPNLAPPAPFPAGPEAGSPLTASPLPASGPIASPFASAAVVPFDPRQPLMSYTRLYDGADAEFAARLRDYLELRADQRSGSWAAAMRRTDEFVRFAARMMVSEMLLLHGGEGRRRYVFKHREH